MRGLVVTRARDEPLLLAAAFGAILLATTTLVALAMFASSVVEAGVERALATASLTSTSTTVTSPVRSADFTAVDELIRATNASLYGRAATYLSATSGSFVVPGQEDRKHPDLLVFATNDQLAEHARLIAGRWPSPGPMVEAAVSRPVAEALDLVPGQVFTTENRLDHTGVKVRVTGVFQLDDPSSERWRSEAMLVRGVSYGSYTTHGPLMVTRQAFQRHFTGLVTPTWTTVPDLRGLPPAALGPLAERVAALKQRLAAQGCQRCGVASRLPETLTQLRTAALVARSTMLIPVLQLLLLSAYALMFTARLLAGHRRMEVALLRARGAGTVRLSLLTAGEALLVALPCAVVAPFLGPPLIALVAGLPWIHATGVSLEPVPGPRAFLLSGAVALACAVLLVLPTLAGARRTYVEVQTSRGERGLLQRAGADVVLLVVAALALWQLQRYGAPVTSTAAGELGIDPLIVTGPALALLTGGLLGLRLVPRISRIAERVTSKRPGLAPALGAWQVSRRPARYAGPALLITMAVAIGVVSLATTATWRASQVDQASHAVGADLRLTGSPDGQELGPLGRGASFAGLPGVTALSPAHRGGLEMSGLYTAVLALDADRLEQVMKLRPDLGDRGLAQLGAALRAGRPEPRLLPMPGGRLVFSVRVRGRDSVRLRATLVDGQGVWHDVRLGPLQEGENRLELDAGLLAGRSGRLSGPVGLRGLTFDVPLGQDDGRLTLAVSGLPGQWSRLFRSATPLPEASIRPMGDGFELSVASGGVPRASHPLVVRLGTDEHEPPIPVVLGAGLAGTLKLTTGQSRDLALDGWPAKITVAGVLRAVPSADQEQPVVLMDLATLQEQQHRLGHPVRPTGEWWLSATGDQALQRVRRTPEWDTSALSLGETIVRLRDDPLAGGLQGALILGFAGALVFAVLGFLVNAAVAARERAADFGILRAMGVSFRQVSGLLAVEQAFVVGLSLVVGTLLAAGVSAYVVPRMVLTGQAAQVTPAVVLELPWGAVLAMLAGIALVLFAVLAALARRLRRTGLGRTLRIGEER
ncbi:ABC transporter permease [Nonomuraea soli]|uniref:ABC3 transporter permease C-terminal domain-containing protein n=1 Tax=Nonomuraea soli TaxID=1032476 RepID=A0A7W0CDA3_9ACTN|nr:ABC transporter permease [Nonomuraea soli]MBA2889050.1 hypothetical protein [Nonomuraea soli]